MIPTMLESLPQSMLDNVTAFFCFLMMMGFVVLHVLSDPKHRKWWNLPGYVRWGFMACALVLLGRGLDLCKLSATTVPPMPGHIDMIGVLATVIMAYTVCALAVLALRSAYAADIRAKVERIEKIARGPHGEALATLALQGVPVVEPRGDLPL